MGNPGCGLWTDSLGQRLPILYLEFAETTLPIWGLLELVFRFSSYHRTTSWPVPCSVQVRLIGCHWLVCGVCNVTCVWGNTWLCFLDTQHATQPGHNDLHCPYRHVQDITIIQPFYSFIKNKGLIWTLSLHCSKIQSFYVKTNSSSETEKHLRHKQDAGLNSHGLSKG